MSKRRLYDAEELALLFRQRHDAWLCDDSNSPLKLPYSTDPADSLGISTVWGFTTETLIGAAFFYVWSWHDARQKYFDMPVSEADALALRWARFTADYWPDEQERKKLQRAVRWFGWLIPVWGFCRWRLLGGKK